MKDLIAQKINHLEAERAQFMLLAPVRADERMQALHTQLQSEITVRLESFDSQITLLQNLLAAPAKEAN